MIIAEVLASLKDRLVRREPEKEPYRFVSLGTVSLEGVETLGLRVILRGKDFLKIEEVRELFGWSQDDVSETPLLIPIPMDPGWAQFNETLFMNLAHQGAHVRTFEHHPVYKKEATLTFFPLEQVNLDDVLKALRTHHSRKNNGEVLADVDIEGLERVRREIKKPFLQGVSS